MDEDERQLVADPAVQEQVRLLREDFKEFSKDMRATIRIIADPVTGYVPRSEIDSRFKQITDNAKWFLATCLTVSSIVTTVIVTFYHPR